MSLRFRRSISLFPGVKINFGKTGVSLSAGVRGAHVTLGRNGTRTTVGLPGTGLSYTHHEPHRAPDSLPAVAPLALTPCAPAQVRRPAVALDGWKIFLLILIAAVLITGLLVGIDRAMHRRTND